MKRSKLRRQIAWDAARMMYERSEKEYYRAKMKAARRAVQGWVRPADLPSNVEIRDQIELLARLHEGTARLDALREMRLEALRIMRRLARFRPRLIGSVMTGHIRKGSDIDLHLFSDSLEAVRGVLEDEGLLYDVERKQVSKFGQQQVYTHIHVRDRFPYELTIYPSDRVHYVPRSSITGRAMERASIAELEQLIVAEHPEIDLDDALEEIERHVDRFQVYHALLLPLEQVRESPRHHPESDALYHSLQVFDLVRAAAAYDEELLLAALLHDVGKAIDPARHVEAGLESLEGFVSERTAWLIENHMLAQQLLEGTLGVRARRRLRESDSYEDLLLLARCDRRGRCCGVEVPQLDEAIDYVRELAGQWGA
jgi:hypothetical protein